MYTDPNIPPARSILYTFGWKFLSVRIGDAERRLVAVPGARLNRRAATGLGLWQVELWGRCVGCLKAGGKRLPPLLISVQIHVWAQVCSAYRSQPGLSRHGWPTSQGTTVHVAHREVSNSLWWTTSSGWTVQLGPHHLANYHVDHRHGVSQCNLCEPMTQVRDAGCDVGPCRRLSDGYVPFVRRRTE